MTPANHPELMNNRRVEIRAFILSSFLPGSDETELHDDDLLFESGIIDSTGAISLILFLEERFQIHILDEELFPRNFASVASILAFLERKTASGITAEEVES